MTYLFGNGSDLLVCWFEQNFAILAKHHKRFIWHNNIIWLIKDQTYYDKTLLVWLFITRKQFDPDFNIDVIVSICIRSVSIYNRIVTDEAR